MLAQHILFACVMAIVHGNSDKCPENAYAHEIAESILYFAPLENLNPEVLAAVAYHESKFNKFARGTHGEIGIFQIKPNGAIQGTDLLLTFDQLADIRVNTQIATHYMGQFSHKCKWASYFLTKYNSGHGKCQSSDYSHGVMADLKLGRKLQEIYAMY